MENVKLHNFGPIKEADVRLGDLTILLGTQASGKSLFLQLFKLAKDRLSVMRRLEDYGFWVRENADNLLNVYLGEGLSAMWRPETSLTVGGSVYDAKDKLVGYTAEKTADSVFYVPAQRILSVADGRPKNFMEFGANDPYVLRAFSETLRLFLQNGLNGSNVIYPLPQRLNGSVKKMFDEAVFHSGKVLMEERGGQRKIAMEVDGLHLPLMTWSAGQKEFLPLLLAFYCLSGPKLNVVNPEQFEYVIIEEPEMGLHPQAILTIILQVAVFIQSGFKVVVSTHSPVFLEFVWAYNCLKNIPESDRTKALTELFGLQVDGCAIDILKGLYDKDIFTYFFSRKNGMVEADDISSLDVMDDDAEVAEWGGLTNFSARVNQIVANYMAEYDER